MTIILPVHNGAEYLGEALASVLSQDVDFELLVLDDESSDASPDIVSSVSDPRLRYFRNPARYGLFKTLNRGFAEATSQLVRLWAQDDRMLPGSLRAFAASAKEHSSPGMVFSDFYAIDASGRRTGSDERYTAIRERTPDVIRSNLAALLFYCFGCLPGNISTVLVRKEAWQRVGGFLTGSQQAPDYDMWVRISEHFSLRFLRQKLVEVRDHEGQLSRLGRREMTTIQEELPVIRELVRRLSPVIGPRELRWAWARGRGCQHVQWIARALARGEARKALRGMKAMSAFGQPWLQAAVWLVTLNGLLVPHRPESLFDRHVDHVLGAVGGGL